MKYTECLKWRPSVYRAVRAALSILTLVGLFSTNCAENQTSANVKVFIGATIIDGTGTAPLADGVLIIRAGRLETVGTRSTVSIPKGADLIDVSGKFIIPGLINAHGHVGDTVGLENGHYSRENVLRQLRLYACYGITTVNSLGGDRIEAMAIRAAEDSTDLNRARLLFAGEVVAGDSQKEARGAVAKNANMQVDFIKFRVDDFLGTAPKMPISICKAIIDEAHNRELPVAAHLFYLEDVKALLRADVDFVAHSIRDLEADEEVIQLLLEKDVSYCPTLTREVSVFVYESEPDFFKDPFFLRYADPGVLDQLRDPERQQRIRNSASAQRYKQALEIASRNLKKLADAGVRIAFGTDSGPPARFQGYFEHMELELMAKAGLTPSQILVSATRDAASALGRTDIGTLEAGKWADFIVLSNNPLDDIKNARTIESVWIAGNSVPMD